MIEPLVLQVLVAGLVNLFVRQLVETLNAKSEGNVIRIYEVLVRKFKVVIVKV